MIVTLDRLWLNAVDEIDVGVSFAVQEITHGPGSTVRVDEYAGGTLRAVRTAGKPSSAEVALKFCTDAQKLWLEEHVGEIICYRDPRAAKFYGVYPSTSMSARRLPDSWSISITVAKVTLDESLIP